ncbi:hypothetical protein SprV_0401637200 [Sparganum proliferum]
MEVSYFLNLNRFQPTPTGSAVCQFTFTTSRTTFVGLTKALDTVNLGGLSKNMQKFGCPERFTRMVRQLHGEMVARVTDNGAVSEAFSVTSGVKQGCVLVPTLFSLMFSVMLMEAYRDECSGIRIANRTDGHLLNSRRMQVWTRLSATMIHNQLFSNNCALNTTTDVDTQGNLDLLAAGCANFGRPTATNSKPWTILLILEAHFSAAPESTMRLPTGSPKPVKTSAGCRTPCGIDTASN